MESNKLVAGMQGHTVMLRQLKSVTDYTGSAILGKRLE